MSSNSLSPENEQFIENAVSVGLYHDRAEALDRAVELLRRREQLVGDVNEGIASLNAVRACRWIWKQSRQRCGTGWKRPRTLVQPMPRLEISPVANRDLVEIGVYIAQQSGSRERADAFLDSILQTCEKLATHPKMGERRENSPRDSPAVSPWGIT